MNNYKQFFIYFYFEIYNKEFIFPIVSSFFNIKKSYVYDLIRNIIKIINNKNIIIINNSINYIVSLKDNEENDIDFYINNYKLKKCSKKTLKPKKDYPSYSSSSLLETITNDKISFISKNPLNIMLTEKYNDHKKECEENDNVYNNIINENTEDFGEYNLNENKEISQYDSINNYKEGICKNVCVVV